jgi:hypothetical protein
MRFHTNWNEMKCIGYSYVRETTYILKTFYYECSALSSAICFMIREFWVRFSLSRLQYFMTFFRTSK